MKRKINRVIGLLCCLFSAFSYAYSDSSLPPPGSAISEESYWESQHPYLSHTGLPLPDTTMIPPKTLTLREAIMLALRSNPDVKSSEIQRIIDKYQVILAKQVFRPQYAFHYTQSIGRSTQPTYALASGMSILTPVGSQVSVDYLNNLYGSGGAARFTWVQPLLRDFGSVNAIPYEDALTHEEIAKLSFKKSIVGVVVGVMIAYRQLVQDFNNLDIQKRFLADSFQALKRYKLKVKVGKMAPSDILQQEANYQTTKLSLVQQENALQQNYQNFLSALGLIPSAKMNISKTIKIAHYLLPSEAVAIQRALDGNIAYHQALLQLENTRRLIDVAKNERKWKLNLVASAQLGDVNRRNNRNNHGLLQNGPSVLLDLAIPIDNVHGKADEVDARVQLEQAKLALEQQKENLIRQVMTQMQTIRSDWQQIEVSHHAVGLQAATLKAAKLRLNYGRSTVFEVTQNQDLLLQQEISLVGTEINYLNDITGLETIWGNTLKVWNIELRY